MEEDIKIVENLINVLNTGLCKFGENVQMSDCGYQQAIENLLKRYKELEEEVESEKFYHNADKEFIQKYHDEASELNTKCINLETQLSNSIPISVIQNKIDELTKYRDLAKEQIEERVVIADSDSLNYGRADAHDKDIQVLQKLLEERNK